MASLDLAHQCQNSCVGFFNASQQDEDAYYPVLPFSAPKVKNFEETDAMLAGEMNRCSMEEREKAFHDIHGVSGNTEESHEMVANKLYQLDLELSKIKTGSSAYELAEKMSMEYVSNPDFRLMFLRADEFDAKKAAVRMSAFFSEKLDLFGSEKLVKDITLNDLNDDDMESLACGCIQVSVQNNSLRFSFEKEPCMN